MLDYGELFEVYKEMGVEYGIMIDVFLNPEETLASAKRALRVYRSYRKHFKLVGVAQGNNVEEYLNCYCQLKEMGYKYIAVGGLLRRRANTVRFPYVRDEQFMFEILRELRQRYPDDWLFALGTFHPNRMEALSELGVWADYKGWIFQYEKRDTTLNSQLATLATNHLEHINLEGIATQVMELQALVVQRSERIAQVEELTQQLVDGRRVLRTALDSLHQETISIFPDSASQFKALTTHGLLDKVEEKLVKETLVKLGKSESIEGKTILESIRRNRETNGQAKIVRTAIDQLNSLLLDSITALMSCTPQLAADVMHFCDEIIRLIGRTEREHRFEQVRDVMAKRILARL